MSTAMATFDTTSSKSRVLTRALLNAAGEMGISKARLGTIIGKDRTVFARTGINPDSKAGELALLLIRCYRSLYALVGGNQEQIHHWMNTENKGTRGIPAQQISRVEGLVRISEYLDSMRGKS